MNPDSRTPFHDVPPIAIHTSDRLSISATTHSRRSMLAGTGKAALGLAATGLLPIVGCAGHAGQSVSRPLRQGNGLAPSRDTPSSDSLRSHAAAHGLLTGCAVVPALLRTDPAYAALVRSQASLIVAENAMKWDALRPTAETYNFDDADALLRFAEQNQMKMRGHNLLWHRSLPRWFAATATRENARGLLEAHIETVAGRYAGRVHSWDVVNEAIDLKDGRPDGLRDSPWLRLVGDDYIEVAFRAARRADPQALLTYNDYGIEAENRGDQAKREAVLLMLRRLRARQVPIDAVGIQSHITASLSSAPPVRDSRLMRFIASVRELDLQVFLTELDVNDRDLPPDIAARDSIVAATYANYLDMVLSDPAVTAVLTWGITDKYTWLDHEDSRADGKPERPLPFDANYKPKPSFFAMRDAFDRRKLIHGGVIRGGL